LEKAFYLIERKIVLKVPLHWELNSIITRAFGAPSTGAAATDQTLLASKVKEW